MAGNAKLHQELCQGMWNLPTIQDKSKSFEPLLYSCPRTRPFTNCSMDMITDLPPVKRENRMIIDAVMVMVDHGLTKGVVLTPCSKTLTHEGAGDILLNHIYKRFGLPDSIISD